MSCSAASKTDSTLRGVCKYLLRELSGANDLPAPFPVEAPSSYHTHSGWCELLGGRRRFGETEQVGEDAVGSGDALGQLAIERVGDVDVGALAVTCVE
jgi:hypothetical protein